MAYSCQLIIVCKGLMQSQSLTFQLDIYPTSERARGKAILPYLHQQQESRYKYLLLHIQAFNCLLSGRLPPEERLSIQLEVEDDHESSRLHGLTTRRLVDDGLYSDCYASYG
jgi:hypothetical protein